MKKRTTQITLEYRYDPNHSGAHYTLDGEHFMNGGDFAEVDTKHEHGFAAKKDGNTAYDIESDIPEMNASVKSSGFTLTSKVLADSFNETIEKYFQTVHSTLWIYVIIIGEEVTFYYMNATEFRQFLETFGTWTERKVIRGRKTSGKMITWLDERVG